MTQRKDEQPYERRNDILQETRWETQFQQDWQNVLHALQQVQGDYSHARKQLEEVYNSFGEKERVASERLRYLMDASTATHIKIHDEKIGSKVKYAVSDRSVHFPVLSLRAYCFGSFEIYLNWIKLDKWHTLKAKSLLKFLVSHKRPVPRDVLIETLWPECDPEAGNNNLKSAAYALRQTLLKNEQETKISSPIILFSGGQYLMDPKLQLWVDIDDFEYLWQAGRRLEKSGEIEEATRQYQSAEELYRGDYLQDEPYAEWTLLRREALKDTYLTILVKLVNIMFKTADYESCIIYCQKILSKDSCHEEAYRWLMRCYNQLGQRHRARQWYNLCVTTLKRELDTVPDPETVKLYHQLLNQDSI